VRPLIASYGTTCQPTQLVAYLNQQISWCGLRNFDGTPECRPTGDEWRMCAPFYDHPVTALPGRSGEAQVKTPRAP